jgi:ArsR family transcriptional regulator
LALDCDKPSDGRFLRLTFHFYISRNMEMIRDPALAVSALASLAQDHRLALFRLLVQAGPDGMAAGALAEALGIPNSSLSFHLAHLNRAGLIEQRRQGRSLIYTANYDAMHALVGFLTENCCGGTDCAPVLSKVEGPPPPPKQARKSA